MARPMWTDRCMTTAGPGCGREIDNIRAARDPHPGLAPDNGSAAVSASSTFAARPAAWAKIDIGRGEILASVEASWGFTPAP